MRLKILAINLSNAFGGLEKYSVDLAAAQARRGHDVTFICQRGKGVEAAVRAAGLECLAFPYRRYIDLPLALKIRNVVREGGFRLVHAHKSDDLGIIAPALWGLKGVSLFFSLHMIVPAPKKDLYHRMEYARVRRLFANGEECVRSAGRNLPINPGTAVEVPLGVETERFTPGRSAAFRRELGFADEDILLGVLSRLDPLKGQMEAVQAMPAVLEKHPRAFLLLAGEETYSFRGIERKRIEAEVARLGLGDKVRFIGFQSDVAKLLNALDVFLLPSHFESYSVSLIEAKLCAVPMVAAASGGVPQNMGHGAYGELCEPKDAASLAAAILRTLADLAAAKAKAHKGREEALKRYSMDAVLDAIDAEYRAALADWQG